MVGTEAHCVSVALAACSRIRRKHDEAYVETKRNVYGYIWLHKDPDGSGEGPLAPRHPSHPSAGGEAPGPGAPPKARVGISATPLTGKDILRRCA